MKIALLIGGVVRLPVADHVKCIKDAQELFSNNGANQITTFCKTWSSKEDLTPIKDLCEYFNDTELCPTQQDLDLIKFPTVGQLKAHPEHIVCRISHYSMLYGTNCLRCEADKHPTNFDLYIRFRNDLSVNINLNEWLQPAVEENCYVTAPQYWMGSRTPCRLNDHLGIAKPEIFNKIWGYDKKFGVMIK